MAFLINLRERSSVVNSSVQEAPQQETMDEASLAQRILSRLNEPHHTASGASRKRKRDYPLDLSISEANMAEKILCRLNEPHRIARVPRATAGQKRKFDQLSEQSSNNVYATVPQSLLPSDDALDNSAMDC